MKPWHDDYAIDSHRAIVEHDEPEARLWSLPSLISPDERVCLMRCSMVLKFDEPLFSRYFQHGEARLADLVERNWIESDKRDRPRYWVSRRLRRAAWGLWWQNQEDRAVAPTPLRELAAQVDEYCRRKGWRIEQLRQRATFDPDQAKTLFERLFKKADARFDLAYCQDLTDALADEEREFARQDLRILQEKRQRRITTRVLRDSEYYQTRDTRFQPRIGAQGALRKLLAPDSRRWLLHLHGAGGMGKTTLLRWFVSRACVAPDPNITVPAAIVNWDDHAATLLSQPWQLLMEAAEQLNDQLPETPFNKLLSEREAPSQGTSIKRAIVGDPRRLEPVGQEIEENFCRNAGTGTPFVIALDGIDFISPQSHEQIRALGDLVELLRRVHNWVSDLRVVLICRHDLSLLVPELHEDDVSDYRVPVFTDAEAREYLHKHRGILEQDKRRAIQTQSKGLPMVVGLYADLVADDPGIKVGHIKRELQPWVDFLVARILRHIDNAIVRYSLLYSIMAPFSPALDLKFFQNVLLQAWRETRPGDHSRLEIEAPPDPDDVPGANDIGKQDQLWAEILFHAEQAMWISAVNIGGEKVVRVHEDVRFKLLAELLGEPIAWRIHALAAAYYQREAEHSLAEKPFEWPGLTARVIYHRIQQGDDGTMAYWHDIVEQSRKAKRIDRIREIARLVIAQPDFRKTLELLAPVGDGDDESSPKDEGTPSDPRILLPILYECLVELARVVAQAPGLLPGSGTATRQQEEEFPLAEMAAEFPLAVVDIDAARAIRDAADARGIEIGRADYESIVSALNIVSPPKNGPKPEDVSAEQFEDALEKLVPTQHTPPVGTASGDASLVRARAYAGRYRYGDQRAAERNLEEALRAFDAAWLAYDATDQAAATYVAVAAAEWLLSIDRPDLAVGWCERPPERYRWQPAHPDGTAAELKARALLALGRPASALEVLSPPAGRVTSAACSLAVLARLALFRPLQAVAEDRGPDTDPPSRRVERELLGAEAASQLLDLDEAERCFGNAQNCMLLLGQADEGLQARINTALGLFELRVTGNVQKAGPYIEAEFDRASVGWSAWTEHQLAQVELYDRPENDRPPENGRRVAAIIDDVFQYLRDVKAPPRARVGAAIAGLAARSVGASERRRYLRALVDELATVPDCARVAMLAGLTRCPPVESDGTDDRLRERLRALVPVEREDLRGLPDEPETTDLAWRLLVRAQVLRVTGEVAEAGKLQSEALLWGLGDDPFVLWRLRGARPERRPEFDDTSDGVPRLVPFPLVSAKLAPPLRHLPRVFRNGYHGYPLLCAAYTEEWASQQPDPYAREVTSSLTRATEWLQSSLWLRETAWQAKLYEILAASKEPSAWKHHDLSAVARRIWVALGVKVKSAELATVGLSLRASLPPASGEIVISEFGLEDTVKVTQPMPGGGERLRGRPVDVTRFDIDRSPQRWATTLGDALAPSLGALRDSNVRLSLPRPALAANPWELVIADGIPLTAHPERRFVFRTASRELTDQHTLLVEKRVAEALGNEFAPDMPLTTREWRDNIIKELRERHQRSGRPLRIRLISPVIGGSLETETRFGRGRRELERSYGTAFRDNPPDLKTLYGPEVAALYTSTQNHGKLQPDDYVDVIHVCTVMEATEQMPVLELEIRGEPPLTARQLDLMVQRLTAQQFAMLVERLTGGVPPLVVLDIFAPPSPVEARRQLLMRNRFAQQLLSLGSVGTVIATGLGGLWASKQWELITTGLERGLNAAEICQNIQKASLSEIQEHPQPAAMDEAGEAHAIAFPATALFTSVDPDRLVPPGLLSETPKPPSASEADA